MFICKFDVIDKLEIRNVEVKLIVYKSERLSRHAKMEGKNWTKSVRNRSFSEKSGNCQSKKKLILISTEVPPFV